MNKSRLHSYLYFILLLIITWKTMCSQICSHWLLLSSSHLVFSLIMIQILWKKSQIVNYKHAQRYDNHFYQVWRFENFCDSSNNLKYHSPPKANTSHDLIHWVLHFCLIIFVSSLCVNTILMDASTHTCTWNLVFFTNNSNDKYM